MTDEIKLPEPYGYVCDVGHNDGNWCQTLNPNPLRTYFQKTHPSHFYGPHAHNIHALFTADQVRAAVLEAKAQERERLLALLAYAVNEADGWHDESRGGPIRNDPVMDAAREAIRAGHSIDVADNG